MHIYIITNQINGKQYIGQTIREDPWKRIEMHFTHKQLSSRLLKNAIKKYGENNFQVKIYSYPEIDINQLNNLEKWFIENYNTISPFGYNLTDGGNNGEYTEESKKKISVANKGREGSFLGRKHTAESKEKMAESQKGIIPWNKGKSGTFLGRKHTMESKRKMADAARGKKHTDKTKLKISKTKRVNPLWKYKKEIIELRNRGLSYQKIADKLSEKYRIKGARHIVQKIWKWYLKGGY